MSAVARFLADEPDQNQISTLILNFEMLWKSCGEHVAACGKDVESMLKACDMHINVQHICTQHLNIGQGTFQPGSKQQDSQADHDIKAARCYKRRFLLLSSLQCWTDICTTSSPAACDSHSARNFPTEAQLLGDGHIINTIIALRLDCTSNQVHIIKAI